jgi:hypothetical protein
MGGFPRDLPTDFHRLAQEERLTDGAVGNWVTSEKYLKCPLAEGETALKFSPVFDGMGGWYYNPTTGQLYPNYKKVRVWIWPPLLLYRNEDPRTW